MKIKPDHLEYMRSEMMKVSTIAPLQTYLNAGLTEKRWRWDWCYKANLSKWICDNLYSYMDDTHIDTALKQITKGV